MNLLGTHDTARILTVLGDPSEGKHLSNAKLSTRRLSPRARAKAVRLLEIGAMLQFTVYGVPSVYYGDEVGLEGYHDPFCRMPYPWSNSDKTLQAYCRCLGALRAESPALCGGTFRFLDSPVGSVCYERKARGKNKEQIRRNQLVGCRKPFGKIGTFAASILLSGGSALHRNKAHPFAVQLDSAAAKRGHSGGGVKLSFRQRGGAEVFCRSVNFRSKM